MTSDIISPLRFVQMARTIIFFIIATTTLTFAAEDEKRVLNELACKKNPQLVICRKQVEELVIPPPMPKVRGRKKDEISDAMRAYEKQHPTARPMSAEELRILQIKCAKISPIVQENCDPKKMVKSNVHRCAAYFRDCNRFIPKGDPLDAIGNSFSSQVGVTVANVGVKGIPYYPINEEGEVGVDVGLSAPFGAWGGGYSDHVGVRDYWSQHQEVGANWVEGKYGYKNGWSVPLVQSLGVEGGQHNTVSVPLKGKDAGTVMVDNGYHVGGYYGHNDHVGVDWKRGDVAHTFGVGVPFAHTGFMTGQAVAFPGLDVWQRALG